MLLELRTALDRPQSRRERTLCNALGAVLQDLNLPSKAKTCNTGNHTSSKACYQPHRWSNSLDNTQIRVTTKDYDNLCL